MIENHQAPEEEQDDQQELYEHYRFVADPGQQPLRVDKFLVNRIMNASRSKIQAAATAGNILVDEKPAKSNQKVKAGQTVAVVMEYPRRSVDLIAQDIPLDIIFEDEHLLVINKPAGMVVHPGYGNFEGTLVNALVYHYKNLPMFNGDDSRPGLVHRIDKDTSGLLVVAKNDVAKYHLASQFFHKTSYRRYLALVWGSFEEEEGTIDAHIGRSLKDRKVMTVFPEGEYGKDAVTHYKVLERLGYVTLVECRLETGRTHQIRAHMKYIKHPLFNDANYGGDKILKGTTFTKYKQYVENCFKICPRQALHARSLGFVHPVTNEYMQFDSELPDDMTMLLEKWRNYIDNRDI